MDIYGLKRNLVGAEEKIKKSSISEQNKKIIFNYEKQLFIKESVSQGLKGVFPFLE